MNITGFCVKTRTLAPTLQIPGEEGEKKRSSAEKISVKRTSKWGSLGRRVAKLKDGESIVLECDGDAGKEAKEDRHYSLGNLAAAGP